VPSFSTSLWSTYQFQEGPLRGWTVGGGITYVGRRTGDLNNSYSVGGYARLDAAVFYDIDEHARFSLNARNLTDRRYIEQPFNPFNNAPGAPLSVLATITAKL
jgi:iron complex outermembrane receptor protein